MKKLTINTEHLKPALKKLSQAVLEKPVLPALSNLYLRAQLDKVELITTDLELTISYVCSCECQEEFEMLIPFNFLNDNVRLMPGMPIEIQLHPKSKGMIVGAQGILHLGTLDKVEDYPKIPDIPKKNSIELDDNLMGWLARSMASIAKDESRPAMSRALLEIENTGITIVSTDAHSLFRHVFPMDRLDYKEQILISPKIAKALEGFEKTALTWHAKHVALKAEDITVISTRPEAKYPDYKVVIPNHGPNLEVNRNALISALNRVSLVSGDLVTLKFLKRGPEGSFTLNAFDNDLDRKSDVAVDCNYSGKADEICFSPKIFSRMLHQIPFEQIRLHIDTPKRAALITAEEDADYLGMIMPLMLQNSK